MRGLALTTASKPRAYAVHTLLSVHGVCDDLSRASHPVDNVRAVDERYGGQMTRGRHNSYDGEMLSIDSNSFASSGVFHKYVE